ncbi:MAG TPA: hypothetical protein VK568_02240 [Thermodesulfobacteriota bacterium]|nr:hypothetical protein [Thermodesulfobacteriota bacterium]
MKRWVATGKERLFTTLVPQQCFGWQAAIGAEDNAYSLSINRGEGDLN